MTDYSWLIEDIETLSAYTADEYTRRVLKHAEDAIEELNRQNEKWEEALKTALDFIPCWVSVTERLPDSGQSCLCYYNGGQFGQLSWISLDRYIDCDELSGFYPFYKDALIGAVTHWMPLPKPPKEETE